MVAPLVEKYRLGAAWLFGSCARCEAGESPDIGLVVDLGPHGRP